ncbi:pyridoxal phosphate-dependent aminotransferase [Neomoorella thermoacetica]|uniref:Aminotransferase n=2 Tax=Neomoorella thermoacetica TaxID=1525 RepID=A0A1D7XBP9_NEOTH|nr:pyridoxal phosphate-dependent aminotransferase [Moorella thermoacetica]AKX94273.1 aspartate aminotransferase [Moorella thermoacetica]AKX96911.1 aspartate aminotransferase [Moorella thermoacetica]AOQ24221.1 Aspartate aminotransferase [Moorella thermoacetica]OIQ08334.1 aspartate aminotransferase [Moorella thermoacetica]OIQ11052.1 aspartate aminotransferase [Moorella thermoacetica]
MQLAQRAAGISPSPTLAIDAQAKAMKAKGVKVINFSAGEPDFGTPEHIKQAAIDALAAGFTRYTPVAGIPELRQAICASLAARGVTYEPADIVVSCGAKHSLYNAMQVLLNAGDEVILSAPYWVSYYEQVKLAGGVPVVVTTGPDTGFKLTPGLLEAAITPRTRLLILNSPCNPTGAVYSREELAALAEVIVARDLIVISDEIYAALLYDGLTHTSIASLAPEVKERTILIDGVSKTYAMTGWRIGYAAAPRPVAKAMTDLQSHSTSNPTSIAQKAAVAALTGSQEAVEMMRREFEQRRNRILAGLRELPGIECNQPGGAFYVFPYIGKLFGRKFRGRVLGNSTDVATALLNEFQVAVVPGVAFGAEPYLRLSYATSMDQIEAGLERLRAFVTELE